jgi:hypothetical protein
MYAIYPLDSLSEITDNNQSKKDNLFLKLMFGFREMI